MCTGLYNDMIEYIDEKKKLFLEFFLSTFEVGAVHGSMYLGLGPCVVGACKPTCPWVDGVSLWFVCACYGNSPEEEVGTWVQMGCLRETETGNQCPVFTTGWGRSKEVSVMGNEASS